MIEVEVLKYGALGIGLAVLGYTAAFLTQELKRHTPRPEARNLILMFMLFSLAAFCIAIFLELREKSIADDVELRNKSLANDFELKKNSIAMGVNLRNNASAIAGIASAMDSSLGGKFEVLVGKKPDHNFVFFTDQLCIDVRKLKAAIGEDSQHTTCKLHGRPDPNP